MSARIDRWTPDWLRWWRGIDDPFLYGAYQGLCVATLWGVVPVLFLTWLIVGQT